MPHLSIGSIGLGVIPFLHGVALDRIPSLRLAAVCDVGEAPFRDQVFRDQVPCHRDHHEMLRRAVIDAVVVAVPTTRTPPCAATC